MADKTKAAMPGRQCNTALLKHRQITRLAAGGQTLSRRNPYAQINCVRLTYGPRDKGEQCSGSVQNNVNRGSEVPTNNVESCEDNQPSLRGGVQSLRGSLRPAQNLQVTNCHLQNQLSLSESDSQTSLRGEPLHNSLRVAQNRPFLRGAVHSITESNPVQLSGSDLAFLRCSDLSFRPQASRTQAEKLAPELSAFSRSTLASISSIRSCGKRIFLVADFALTDLVAISLPQISVGTPYIKKECKNSLDVWPHFKLDWCGRTLFSRCGNSEARQCANTNRASYHNVTEAYIMACIQHTQTRPKYQYRFLALSAIGRNVIHITATTEREAREQSPAGCVMVFAGRLPVEVRHA